MREMKDSGIEWIGEIPTNWKVCKQKYEIELVNGRAYSDSEFEEEGKYRILRVGNLFSNPTWYTSSMELPQDKYCEKGDLLYSWSMSYAPVIWTGEKVIYHYHIWKAKLSRNLYKKFAYYYLFALTDALKAQIHETTMGFITMGIMNNSYIAFPCSSEQRRIADFLDAKCAEIDSLTANIQTQIDTLEQYKCSVITKAVTKGINSEIEMKDSEISYIGYIPKHWNITKLKYLGKFQNGISKGREYFGTGFPFVSYGDVYKNYDLPRNVDGLILSTKAEQNIYSVKYGDVFFTRTSETIEEIGFASTCLKSIDNSVFAGFLIRFRPTSNNLVPEFSKFYFRSTIHRKFFVKEMNLVTRASLGQNLLGGLAVLLPPVCEQKLIAQYLEKKCAEIDGIIENKKEQLEILGQYKKSIIYEYVTGKKEVPADGE